MVVAAFGLLGVVSAAWLNRPQLQPAANAPTSESRVEPIHDVRQPSGNRSLDEYIAVLDSRGREVIATLKRHNIADDDFRRMYEEHVNALQGGQFVLADQTRVRVRAYLARLSAEHHIGTPDTYGTAAYEPPLEHLVPGYRVP